MSEHQFDRPDARRRRGPPPSVDHRGWPRLSAILGLGAGIEMCLLIFYLPVFVYGDPKIMIGLGWVSMPLGILLGTLTGIWVYEGLYRSSRGDYAFHVPRESDIARPFIFTGIVVFLAGIGLAIACAQYPSSY